jgi:hypothetical protein
MAMMLDNASTRARSFTGENFSFRMTIAPALEKKKAS